MLQLEEKVIPCFVQALSPHTLNALYPSFCLAFFSLGFFLAHSFDVLATFFKITQLFPVFKLVSVEPNQLKVLVNYVPRRSNLSYSSMDVSWNPNGATVQTPQHD